MDFDWQDKLIDRFNFYKGIYFECGEGWFNLIWELSENIEKELNKLSNEEKESFKIMQVKQKYGELRIYTNRYIKEIDILIDNATDKSLTICEECGQPGKLVGHNWIEVICDDCQKRQGGK